VAKTESSRERLFRSPEPWWYLRVGKNKQWLCCPASRWLGYSPPAGKAQPYQMRPTLSSIDDMTLTGREGMMRAWSRILASICSPCLIARVNGLSERRYQNPSIVFELVQVHWYQSINSPLSRRLLKYDWTRRFAAYVECVFWVKFYGGSKLRLNTVRHVTSIGPSITPVSTLPLARPIAYHLAGAKFEAIRKLPLLRKLPLQPTSSLWSHATD